MMTDPISDLFTRIRNSLAVGHPLVSAPYSKLKAEVATILKSQGYVADYQKKSIEGAVDQLEITLKYRAGRPAIRSIQRVSKPGRRVYAKNDSLPVVLNNLGIAIISTSQGLMTNKQAKEKKLGGEVVGTIY